MMNERKPRLFVDMDGTLAVFNRIDKLETLYERGYFADLTPRQMWWKPCVFYRQEAR